MQNLVLDYSKCMLTHSLSHSLSLTHTHTHTHTHTQASTHTSILTIQSLIYTDYNRAANKDLRRMKTAARNGKHGRYIVLERKKCASHLSVHNQYIYLRPVISGEIYCHTLTGDKRWYMMSLAEGRRSGSR